MMPKDSQAVSRASLHNHQDTPSARFIGAVKQYKRVEISSSVCIIINQAAEMCCSSQRRTVKAIYI